MLSGKEQKPYKLINIQLSQLPVTSTPLGPQKIFLLQYIIHAIFFFPVALQPT
jgi:hypothetical protein